MTKKSGFALCSLGHLGIVECDEPQKVTYPDGNTGVAWVGRHILPVELFGKPWSTRCPRWVYLEGMSQDERLAKLNGEADS